MRGHEFDFQHMMEQRKRFRVDGWLAENMPHTVVKRRVKGPKPPAVTKQQTLRRIKIEIILHRFGEYLGQTKTVYETYSSIA